MRAGLKMSMGISGRVVKEVVERYLAFGKGTC
jgi:hypothetical protein